MQHAKKIIAELSEFISYQTISSNAKNKPAIGQCARWLQQHLHLIGMRKTKIYSTSTHPVVYSEYITDPSLKTILFYGHYDVQPVDPLEQWHTPPFKAVINGDYIFGRGVSDDKGQLFIHIKAVESLIQQTGSLPVNVKFLIEGAEEIGSEGLKDFITANARLLKCDAAIVSDTKMMAENIPAITYSLRGSLNAEIFIRSSMKDLHSGTFGGGVPNAAIAMSNFISGLHNKDGTIAIPGFYDDVQNISPEERNFIRINGATDNSLVRDATVMAGWGENKYTVHERTTIRPSLAVTGITSGFQGIGVKNIIPSVASVKLNFRLVAHQRPGRIKKLLDDVIKNRMPGYVTSTVAYSSFSNPVYVSRNNGYISAAIKAYENVFRNNVKLTRAGGTIAAVDYLHTVLQVPVVMMGFAQASDNMHAPDEKMYLPNFFRGIGTAIRFMQNVALLKSKKDLHAVPGT